MTPTFGSEWWTQNILASVYYTYQPLTAATIANAGAWTLLSGQQPVPSTGGNIPLACTTGFALTAGQAVALAVRRMRAACARAWAEAEGPPRGVPPLRRGSLRACAAIYASNSVLQEAMSHRTQQAITAALVLVHPHTGNRYGLCHVP